MDSPAEEGGGLAALSDQIAARVDEAGAWVVHVAGRRGYGASGILLRPDTVVTADHVLESGREDRISVRLADGREVGATLVGRDGAADLAVLRLEEAAGAAEPPTAGEEPRVGSLVLVVARPGSAPAASLGLVSGGGGPGRTRRGAILERYLQIDAVMYPGFSGGAVVDARGRIAGLVSSGLGSNGPAIALPWPIVSALAGLLLEHGRVPRGYLGIGSQPVALAETVSGQLAGQASGLLIVQVVSGGPADQAGLLQGDILVGADGRAIRHPDDLQLILTPDRVGSTIDVSLVRAGAIQTVPLTVGTRA